MRVQVETCEMNFLHVIIYIFLNYEGTKYSCLENPMDGGAWWAAVHGVAKSQTWLSDFTFTFFMISLGTRGQSHLFGFPFSYRQKEEVDKEKPSRHSPLPGS